MILNKSYTEGLLVSIKLSMSVVGKINQEGASLVLQALHFHLSMELKRIITQRHIRGVLQKITATLTIQVILKRT